jgi:hypothetical protein
MKRHTETYDLYGYLKDYIDFDNKTILDFGGSFGNLIISSNGKIEEKNYTCLDVDKFALLEGQQNFPNAQWVWYNRYNTMYNPSGNKEWPLLNTYDLIFSYSVFTHTSYQDLLETIAYLKTRLNKNGEIYISYASQSNKLLIDWLTEKRIKDYENFDTIQFNNKYVYIKDNKVVDSIPSQSTHFFTLYNDDFLKNLGDIIKTDCALQDFLRIKNNE